jgi:excinuclease UvrABC ATPase subunit
VAPPLGPLDRRVDSGASVMAPGWHRAVMARADRIAPLGPGAGRDSPGTVLAGTPGALAAGRCTLAGPHLAASVGL